MYTFDPVKALYYGEVAMKLLLAVLCGGVIGLERGRKGRPAGFRTHVLVCLGAALAMMTNEFIVLQHGGGDPTRMAAQVVSGIGFLGAGTILVTGRKQVKGLTTAASLWASACLGLAIGSGFYVAALAGGILIWAVNSLLHRLEEPIHDSAKVITIYVEIQDVRAVRRILEFAREQEIRVSDMELIRQEELEGISMGMTANLRLMRHMDHQKLHRELEELEDVEFIEFM